VYTGRIEVSREVTTDIELFARRVARARRLQPSEAVETLQAALALVSGQPFDYRSTEDGSYTWITFEDWAGQWDARITASPKPRPG
jgi:hypothetical protein